MFDTATGRSVATLLEKTSIVELIGKSRDGKTWLIADFNRSKDRLLQLDLSTRTVTPLPLSSAAVGQRWQDRLSFDGRFAAIYNPPKGFFSRDPKTGGLILWDTVGKKQRVFLPELDPPYEFSADGRSLAVTIGGRKARHVGILDLETLKVRETQIPDSSTTFDSGCLSDDGSYLAEFVVSSGGKPFEMSEINLICWKVATGEEVIRESVGKTGINKGSSGRVGFTCGGRHLVLFPAEWGSQSIRCFDLANGRSLSDRFPQENQGADISPDGRFVLVMNRESGRPREKEKWFGQVYDAEFGHYHGLIPGKGSAFQMNPSPPASLDVGWAPDGKTLAVKDQDQPGVWHLWDMPPKTRLSLFVQIATALAVLLARLARWLQNLSGATP
jgi:hypothetical protein